LSKEDLARVLPRTLPKQTSRSIDDVDEFEKHLQLTRKQGFAFDDEEGYENVRSLAVPIFGRGGRVLAALSLLGPSSRMDEAAIARHIQSLQQYALLISQRI